MRINRSVSKNLVRRTPEEIERLVHEFGKSGLTQRQYAEQLGVALSTLTRWLREGGKRVPGPRVAKPKFIEVDMDAVSPRAAHGVYQIDLPGGVRLRAEGAWQPEQVRQLLNILQRS